MEPYNDIINPTRQITPNGVMRKRVVNSAMVHSSRIYSNNMTDATKKTTVNTESNLIQFVISCQSPPSKVVLVVSTKAIKIGDATGSSKTGNITSRILVLIATAANSVAIDENPIVPKKNITNSLVK